MPAYYLDKTRTSLLAYLWWSHTIQSYQLFHSTTKHHLTILHASEQLKKALPLPPLIAFRRLRNLSNLLVQATLVSMLHESPGNRPCGAIRCKTCPILLATDEFSSHATGEVFKVNTKASCRSSRIIYLNTCRRCGQKYVGETEQPLHCRINGHQHDMAHRRTEAFLWLTILTATGTR